MERSLKRTEKNRTYRTEKNAVPNPVYYVLYKVKQIKRNIQKNVHLTDICAHAKSQKRSAICSNFNEDDRALPF